MNRAEELISHCMQNCATCKMLNYKVDCNHNQIILQMKSKFTETS